MMKEITIGKQTFFVPDSDSPCELWRSYFDKLKGTVGRENAKTLWLLTWSKNGSLTCTTNANFNNWLKKNDIDISTAATRVVADISQIGGNILGLGKSFTKMLSIGVPIVLGSAMVFILIVLLNTAEKTDVSDLATLATSPVTKIRI